LPEKTRLRNDILHVEREVKFYSLTEKAPRLQGAEAINKTALIVHMFLIVSKVKYSMSPHCVVKLSSLSHNIKISGVTCVPIQLHVEYLKI